MYVETTSNLTWQNKYFFIVAVYIDSLVMISIEKSKTNKKSTGNLRQIKKEHWKSKTNLSQTMNCVSDWANAKSMAKIWYKFHGLRQICLRFSVLS